MSTAPCIHHYRITPAGPGIERGLCRLCGAERQYRTDLDEGRSWNRKQAPLQPSTSRMYVASRTGLI